MPVGERQLRSNENFLVRKKLNCPIADIDEPTQPTLICPLSFQRLNGRSQGGSHSNMVYAATTRTSLLQPFFWKEARNVIGNHSVDRCAVYADRCDSYLATQQNLGLWPERWAGTDTDHPADSNFSGTVVTPANSSFEYDRTCKGKQNENVRELQTDRDFALLAFGLAACEKPGSAQSAGKKIDQTVAEVGKKISETTDKAGEKLSAEGEKADVAIDDTEITAKVKAAIFAELGLKTLQISVDTVKGVVTLCGSVDSQASSDKTQTIAGAVAGVKEVNNKLLVK